ncbi:ClbS/DfsB family four-helix bundle protein [Demequina iriomotensis]|uniref:ClbS/DfsB family four-helix bundle protein n=1 Tax=Demequina iriomotensis TaxID=1536641 RepID=UPI00146FDC48|nr:ClbS/DfsB family four-helix bundle protein [Demequina iriomotensis]
MTPTSMDALIREADAALAALLSRTDATPDGPVAPGWDGGARVADVLAHLHGWHGLLLVWLDAEARGATPAFPADGYGWDRLADLNAALVAAHAHRPYAEVRALLAASHLEVIAALRGIDETSVFDPVARPWLGDQSLGDVAHECLGAHYAWGEGVLGTEGASSE